MKAECSAVSSDKQLGESIFASRVGRRVDHTINEIDSTLKLLRQQLEEQDRTVSLRDSICLKTATYTIASTSGLASASQTRVAPIQNRRLRVWDGTASSQYIAVGPWTSISVQFHKCIFFQLRP